MTVALPWRSAERAAGAVRQREVAVLHLHLRMRLAAQLAHRLDHLGDAAAVGRMVVAEPAAIGVERQLADARDQVAVGHERAALALLAEAEVLELHQHGDGEAVVDRGVLDVGGLDARLGEGRRAATARARVGQIDLAAHLVSWRPRRRRCSLTLGRLSLAAISGATTIDGAAAVGDDAAVEPMQRIGDHRRVHHLLDRDHVAQHRVRVVLRVVRGRDLDPGELLATSCRTRACGAWRTSRTCSRRSGRRETRTARPASACRRGVRGAVPVAMPSARGRPARVISATLHLPAAIASAAWPTCST